MLFQNTTFPIIEMHSHIEMYRCVCLNKNNTVLLDVGTKVLQVPNNRKIILLVTS